MSEVVLLARLTAKPGKQGELLDLLRSALDGVRTHEPGCVQMAFHTSTEDADVVVAYERYASPEAAQEHRANYARIPEYADFQRSMQALLAKPPEVQRLAFAAGFSREPAEQTR